MPPTKKQRPAMKATPAPVIESHDDDEATRVQELRADVAAAVVDEDEPGHVEHDDTVDDAYRELTVVPADSLDVGSEIQLAAEGELSGVAPVHEFGGGANYVPVPGSDAPRSQQEVDALN